MPAEEAVQEGSRVCRRRGSEGGGDGGGGLDARGAEIVEMARMPPGCPAMPRARESDAFAWHLTVEEFGGGWLNLHSGLWKVWRFGWIDSGLGARGALDEKAIDGARGQRSRFTITIYKILTSLPLLEPTPAPCPATFGDVHSPLARTAVGLDPAPVPRGLVAVDPPPTEPTGE